MKRDAITILIFGLTGTLHHAVGQAPQVLISPNTAALAGPSAFLSPPLLGFASGPGPTDLRAVLGTSRSPHLSTLLKTPPDIAKLYLAPRGTYLLLETNSEPVMKLWAPQLAGAAEERKAVPLEGALARPDQVVFSPRGDAAALYSRSNGTIQSVRGLPAQPEIISYSLPRATADVAALAVSDNGTLAVSFDDGGLFFSSGHSWRPITVGVTASALTFMPGSDDLVASDKTQKLVVLLGSSASRLQTTLLANGIQADTMAITKDGRQVLAAALASGKIWRIDIGSASTEEISVPKSYSLESLRDGQSFLLSSSAGFSLVKTLTGAETFVEPVK